MKQTLLVLVAIAGCSKSTASSDVSANCEGAACFARLEHDVPEFSPDKGAGAYFWETGKEHLYLEIRDTKHDKALIIETKKPMTEGKTYSIGGRDTDWSVSGFSDIATGENLSKGTVKIISLPKAPLEPVVIEIDLRATNAWREQSGGPAEFHIHGRAVVGVYVSNGK